MVLEEKRIKYRLVEITGDEQLKGIQDQVPQGTKVPIIQEREHIIYDPTTILYYLDERYPAPNLMPIYPVARAKTRLAMRRIDRDLYSMWKLIEANDAQAEEAKKALLDSFKAIEPVFKDSEFFMSEEMTIVDCALAVLLWHLKESDIMWDKNSELNKYAKRMFSLENFVATLSAQKKRRI